MENKQQRERENMQTRITRPSSYKAKVEERNKFSSSLEEETSTCIHSNTKGVVVKQF